MVQILLDFGLAEELTPRVRRHFISFLHAISKGDAAAGARHMLQFGAVQVWPRRALVHALRVNHAVILY